MTSTVVALSLAYVVLGVLLLWLSLESRLAWWIKASAIVVTSGFFVVAFFATNGLLGWPGRGALPEKFQLLWTRVVEPDRRLGDAGAIYFWVEEVDDDNVPSGTPRSYRLPYSRELADRSLAARDEIMAGRPQLGLAGDLAGEDAANDAAKRDGNAQEPESRTDFRPAQAALAGDAQRESGTARINMDALLAQAQPVRFRPMPAPTLPPKVP